MAIAVDSTSQGLTGYAGSLTYAHTVSGANAYLIALGAAAVGPDVVVSCTYNGVAMTRLGVAGGGIFSSRTYIYGIPLGTGDGVPHNIVWTFTVGDMAMDGKGISFTGVDQTAALEAFLDYANGYTQSPRAMAVDPPAGAMVVDYFAINGSPGGMTPGAGQTEIGTQTSLIPYRGAASYGLNDTSMSWTFAAGEYVASHAVAVLKPAGSGGGGDTVNPSMTGSLAVGTVTSTSIQVSWSAGTDNVAVTSYETSTNGTSWTDRGASLSDTFTGLTPSTSYTLRVRAKDAAGNVSSALSVTQSTDAALVYGFDTPPIKNNTGTLLASISGWTANVYSSTTGALVAQITEIGTDAAGVARVEHASLAEGATYSYEMVHPTYGRRLPLGTTS